MPLIRYTFVFFERVTRRGIGAFMGIPCNVTLEAFHPLLNNISYGWPFDPSCRKDNMVIFFFSLERLDGTSLMGS